MLAKCHDCMGHYADGMVDCENVGCPLYSWMPYREKDADLEWMKYNPKRKGKVVKEKKKLTPEQREILSKRMKKTRRKLKKGN